MKIVIKKITTQESNKQEFFVNDNASLRRPKTRIKKSTAYANLSLVVVILGLILSLSVMSNYLFFEQLLASSFIILSLSLMKFLDLNHA